jgi:hypothetical protein
MRKKPKKLTTKQIYKHMNSLVKLGSYDTDNQAQLIIYTGIYQWSDGGYRFEPEFEE